MTKINLILFLSIVFALILLISFFKTYRHKKWLKKINSFASSFLFKSKLKVNPYMDTDNWELHKLRLEKFGRSQYKGVIFFLSSEGRIYYFSEDATKVYC